MKTFICSICFLCITFFSNTQNNRQTIKKIDSYLKAQFESDIPGASILVSKKGEILYKEGYGLANMEWQIPIETNTVFQIGSVTKLFTAIAILQLVEQKKLSLTDTIQNFIPSFPLKNHTITIEHLLTHSSGIPDYMTMYHSDSNVMRRDFESIEIINFFKDEPLDFIPGSKSAYTSSGPFLLGYIIEVVSGMPYGKYIEKYIFKEVGMTNSFYGVNSKVIPNRANSYSFENSFFRNGDYRSMSIPYSSGAILSTVEDMNKWQKALFDGHLINKELLDKAIRAHKLNDGSRSVFGLGAWFVDYLDIQNYSTLAHSGGISAFNSFLIYLPKQAVFVVVLSNTNKINVQEIATEITKMVLGKKRTPTVTINPFILENYKGKYKMIQENKSNIALIKEIEGKLVIEVIDKFKLELSPINETTFLMKNAKPKATLEFVKDANGTVTKFVANQGGLIEWEKIE